MKVHANNEGALVAKYRDWDGNGGEITINNMIQEVTLSAICLTEEQVNSLEKANGQSNRLIYEMFPHLQEAEWFRRGGVIYVDG